MKAQVKQTHLIDPVELAKMKVGLYQVCDFNAPAVRRTGRLRVVPVHNNKFKDVDLAFKVFVDSKRMIVYGVPSGKETNGDTKFRQIRITGHREFDLSLPQDAMEFYVLSNHPACEGSPFQAAKPLVKIMDAEKEANNYIADLRASREIEDMLLSDSTPDSQIKDWGMLFGYSPEVNGVNVIRKELIEKARRSPEEIKKILGNVDEANMKILLMKGSQTEGVVEIDQYGGYKIVEGPYLGVDLANAVNSLLNEPRFAEMIRVKMSRKKERPAAVKSKADRDIEKNSDESKDSDDDGFGDEEKPEQNKGKQTGKSKPLDT